MYAPDLRRAGARLAKLLAVLAVCSALAALPVPVAAVAAISPAAIGRALAERLPTAPQLTAAIPARPGGARSGSEFANSIANLPLRDRRAAVRRELLSGNIPSFLRRLRPVVLESDDPLPVERKAVIWVMPDYLAVGSDDDFVRVPLGLDTALEVARSWGFVLPTRKMVDTIYRQADVRLQPITMPPGPLMSSVDYMERHQNAIERARTGYPLGLLVGGQKKDLVLTNRLEQYSDRVAIYGWHRDEDNPIQPLSTVHGARYADYSHGVRLVAATVLVDGQARALLDVLQDPDGASLLSDEGVNRHAARLLSERPQSPAARARRHA